MPRPTPILTLANPPLYGFFTYVLKNEIDEALYVGQSIKPLGRITDHLPSSTADTPHWTDEITSLEIYKHRSARTMTAHENHLISTLQPHYNLAGTRTQYLKHIHRKTNGLAARATRIQTEAEIRADANLQESYIAGLKAHDEARRALILEIAGLRNQLKDERTRADTARQGAADTIYSLRHPTNKEAPEEPISPSRHRPGGRPWAELRKAVGLPPLEQA